MRAPIFLLAALVLLSAAPLAAADAPRPGCDETFSHREICYTYQDLDEARECIKNLRWCIIGPI